MASVNRPTNKAVKEKDINQKLQLYGIYQAFANGKVPSNKQIDVALNSALASKALSSPSSKLSEEGRKLVGDLKEVIQQAKHLLLSKNDGNVLQEFIWDTQNLDGSNAKLPNAPTDKATAQQHGDEALEGLKTLGRLILSNGQFRKLLNDAVILMRDMAGDAAQNVASRVNPSQDQLSQIDHPAEDNTWHEVPDLSKENLKGQARDAFNQNKPFSREEVRDAAQQGLDTAQQHPTADNQEAGRVGLQHATDTLRGRAQQNIPDERQEDARKAKEAASQNAKNYLNKKVPQERRDQTIWRLKKMVVEIQGHSDYRQAIDTLLSLAETYGGHAADVHSQSTGTIKGAHEDDRLKSAEANLKVRVAAYGDNKHALTKLKTLIERFANYTSTDDFFDALNNIYRDADRDPELKGWFKAVDKYIRRCLQEQGYILQDEANVEYNRLQDKGRFLLRDRYRNHTDRILDEIKFLADQFDQDPQNRAFGDAVQKLFLDLGNDENGKATFKPHLIKDLTEVIIPEIFENTRYIPIPRIEVSDPTIDAVVENLVIESDNLFPNVFEFGSDNYFRMGRKGASSKRENKFTVAGSGIQMDLQDVAYYIKKKQGFPSITDKGVMDIFLGGEGFSFKIAARNANAKDRSHFVAVDKVDITIKNLNVKIKQSNHKLLFKIAKPLLLKTMRPVIQKVLEKQIRDTFMKADAFAYSVHQDVQRGKEAALEDPENAPNIWQSYWNSYQKMLTEKKEKAKEVASKTNVNMAMTKQDSIFQHISLPGGVSTKATEYKELAAKGERWESPVFSIGSAKESTDLPKSKSVSRKPHDTASGTIRGGNHPNDDNLSTVTGTTATSNVAGTTPFSTTGAGQVPEAAGLNTTGNIPPAGNNPFSATGAGQAPGAAGLNTTSTVPPAGNNPFSTTGTGQAPGAAGFGSQVDRAFGTNKDITNGGPNAVGNVTNGSTNKTYYDGVTSK